MKPTVKGLDGLATGRCLVMGVVNVTPDSFSDGGRWFGHDAAVEQGLALVGQGADIIDVGGESTRPGAARVEPAEEGRRVVPVVRDLVAQGCVVSVDTMRAEVARECLEVGAHIVNDVSAGLADDAMTRLVAESGAAYVAMHWRGHSDRMAELATYRDVVGEVRDELSARLDALVSAGADPEQVILDPGLGFSKNSAHNWALLRGLDQLLALGRPVLVAASRKRFLGHLLADDDLRPPLQRDDATAAITALSAAAGVWGVRVHEVAANADAVRVVTAWNDGPASGATGERA